MTPPKPQRPDVAQGVLGCILGDIKIMQFVVATPAMVTMHLWWPLVMLCLWMEMIAWMILLLTGARLNWTSTGILESWNDERDQLMTGEFDSGENLVRSVPSSINKVPVFIGTCFANHRTIGRRQFHWGRNWLMSLVTDPDAMMEHECGRTSSESGRWR